MYENCVVEEGWGGGGVEGGVEVEVRVALGGVEGMSSIVWGGGWEGRLGWRLGGSEVVVDCGFWTWTLVSRFFLWA